MYGGLWRPRAGGGEPPWAHELCFWHGATRHQATSNQNPCQNHMAMRYAGPLSVKDSVYALQIE